MHLYLLEMLGKSEGEESGTLSKYLSLGETMTMTPWNFTLSVLGGEAYSLATC